MYSLYILHSLYILDINVFRLADLQGPFDQFWLPPLLCVFKFDYWLGKSPNAVAVLRNYIVDDEDWYEHGYDENQLQGDAYQHLFIGWYLTVGGIELICFRMEDRCLHCPLFQSCLFIECLGHYVLCLLPLDSYLCICSVGLPGRLVDACLFHSSENFSYRRVCW